MVLIILSEEQVFTGLYCRCLADERKYGGRNWLKMKMDDRRASLGELCAVA
jgi:hypothetical protein